MQNNNEQALTAQEIQNKKNNLLQIRLSAFKSQERPSYFEQLDNGALRRAVEREAIFNVKSYTHSDSYAKELNENDVDDLYFAHVEYYSKKIIDNRNRSNYNPYEKDSFEQRLLDRDSRANQNFENRFYPIKKKDNIISTSNFENKIKDRAAHIDSDVKQGNKDVAAHIQKMKRMEEIRVYR